MSSSGSAILEKADSTKQDANSIFYQIPYYFFNLSTLLVSICYSSSSYFFITYLYRQIIKTSSIKNNYANFYFKKWFDSICCLFFGQILNSRDLSLRPIESDLDIWSSTFCSVSYCRFIRRLNIVVTIETFCDFFRKWETKRRTCRNKLLST